MTEEIPTKVHFDLPNHWATGGESCWAEDLGSNLYQIRNVLFYAYGVNFLDVVRATPDDVDLKPEVREIVKSSGHRTLRVYFNATVSNAEQRRMLNELKPFKATYERGTDTHVAIDIETTGDYGEVCDQLYEWENENLLSYETCEARAIGSFDDNLDAG